MRKIIDDRGRLFGRFSVIDVIVVIVAVVLVFAFYTKFNIHITPLGSRDTIEISYTFIVPTVRMATVNHLRVGDKVYVHDTGAHTGTISRIEIADAEMPENLLDGTYIMTGAEDRYDVTLTIDAECSVSNGRYYIDRTFELRANGEFRFITKYNDITGTVMAITEWE